ncbi:hypothetical protein BUQ74_07765 [Leptospira weilii serovar Heyan]|nr:hypothetical protein BUQ74_07765 [Leptospira weilii serovar Heyan]
MSAKQLDWNRKYCSLLVGFVSELVPKETKASRFYWRSKKLSVSLLLALEETQRLASIGARRDLNSIRIFFNVRK